MKYIIKYKLFESNLPQPSFLLPIVEKLNNMYNIIGIDIKIENNFININFNLLNNNLPNDIMKTLIKTELPDVDLEKNNDIRYAKFFNVGGAYIGPIRVEIYNSTKTISSVCAIKIDPNPGTFEEKCIIMDISRIIRQSFTDAAELRVFVDSDHIHHLQNTFIKKFIINYIDNLDPNNTMKSVYKSICELPSAMRILHNFKNNKIIWDEFKKYGAEKNDLASEMGSLGF